MIKGGIFDKLVFLLSFMLVLTMSIASAETTFELKSFQKSIKTQQEGIQITISGKDLEVFNKNPQDFVRNLMIQKGYTANKVIITGVKAAGQPGIMQQTLVCYCSYWYYGKCVEWT